MITKKVIIYINGRNGLIILILELRKVYIFYNLFFASVASSIQAGAYENNSTVLKIFYRFVGELFFICHLATTPSLTSSIKLHGLVVTVTQNYRARGISQISRHSLLSC